MNTDRPERVSRQREGVMDLVPSDIRLIAIAAIVVVLVAVVAWEYTRRRAATPHKKINSD
jgi:hypothetical protein